MPQQPIAPVSSHGPIAPVASHAREVKHVTPKGRILRLPEDISEEDAAAAVEATDALPEEKSLGGKALNTIKALGSFAVDPMGLVSPTIKSTLADMSSGAAKNVGRTALDLSSLYTPGRTMASQLPDLQSENMSEKMGSTAADIAMAIAPAAAGRVGVNTVRQGANLLERGAVPMSREAADVTLKSGAGRVTQANADKLAALAAERTLPNGVIIRPKPAVQEAAAAMEKAANKAPTPLWGDAAVGSGAYWLGGPKLAGAAAALKFLHRPAVKSTIAQIGYGSAPVLGPTGAGAVGGPVFRQVLDWLLKGEDK